MTDDATTDARSTDRPNRVPWPPLIYVAGALLAVAVDRTFSLHPLTLPPSLGPLGWGLVVLGVGVAIAGVVTFKRAGAVVNPTGPATVLATGGIYGWTRNPMYLGAMTFFLGLGLALKSGGLLAVVPMMALALDRLAIRREEAYLRRRFGAAYDDYTAKVGRWL